MTIFEQFNRNAEVNNLFGDGDKILLGVSGGIDSMVLLNLFIRTGREIGVAHCNFSLRGEESDSDQELVETFCRENNIECHVKRFDTKKYAAEHHLSIQMAARVLRYDFFDALCAEHGYTKVAIAHNSDDTCETLFINLIRGTGIRGMAGIPMSRARVIRPILFASRKRIMGYASREKVVYREDSSNSSNKYLRNKLRHDVIPLLKDISDDFIETMTNNAERVAEAVEVIDGLVTKLKKAAQTVEGVRTEIDLNVLSTFSPRDYLLYEIMRDWGFERSTATDIINCHIRKESGRIFLTDEYQALLDRDSVFINPRDTKVDNAQVIIDKIGDTFIIDNREYVTSFVEDKDVNLSSVPKTVAYIDGDTITMPLTVRTWRAGDTFVPLGMSGRKKVSDFLVDNKVSMLKKAHQRVILSENKIIWLTCRRVDDRFKVTPTTKKIVKIEVLKLTK